MTARVEITPVVAVLAEVVAPKSVLHIASPGAPSVWKDWAEAYRHSGVDEIVMVVPSLSEAGNPGEATSVLEHDLRSPLVLDRPVDLAFVPAGVADTIPADIAPLLAASLCRQASAVAFVAPLPGDDLRTNHARWPAWWDSLFEQQGFGVHDVLRWRLWDDDRVPLGTRQGLVLYSADDRFGRPQVADQWWRSVVHPEAHLRVITQARERYERDVTAQEAHLAAVEEERLRLADHVRELLEELDRTRQEMNELQVEPDHVRALEDHIVDAEGRAAAANLDRARLAAAVAATEREVAGASYRPVDVRQLRRRPQVVATRTVTSALRIRRGFASRFGAPAPLFDGAWYVTRYPDVMESPLSPLWHYRRHGAQMRRSPHPWFDVKWYLERNPDVASSGRDPVVHYLEEGWQQGGEPHPAFSTDWYSSQVDLEGWNASPLEHYLTIGRPAGLSPHPLLNVDWLVAQGCPSIEDYQSAGWHRGVSPHPLFDVDWYLATYLDVAAAGLDPLNHYLGFGWREGRDPHPLFDVTYYLEQNVDVRAADVEPLTHFVTVGAAERRATSVLFDAAWYVAEHPEAGVEGVNPLVYFLEVGVSLGHAPAPQLPG